LPLSLKPTQGKELESGEFSELGPPGGMPELVNPRIRQSV
jgi:hypothetical protein